MLSLLFWFGLVTYSLCGLVVGIIWCHARRNDFLVWERFYLLPWIVFTWFVPFLMTMWELYRSKTTY